MWPFRYSSTSKEEISSEPSSQLSTVVEESSPTNIPIPTRIISKDELFRQKIQRDEWLGYSDERLGIYFPLRAMVLSGVSFFAGASLGAATGSPIAADRYRAENAHRLPTTKNGWFLYHKSKNYHAILGGMKEGAKFGTVLTTWALMFMATEEIVDRSRARLFARREDEEATGQRDVASTVIAAMSVAGVYNWKQGFDKYNAARTAKMALKYSLVYGLAQDVLATLRGSRPAYIDWIIRKTLGPTSRMEID